MLTLVLGGSRSGKSAVAESIAHSWSGPVCYVATASPVDPEMAGRIETHRARRPAAWVTIEAATDLRLALDQTDASLLLVDSITVWLGTLLAAAGDDPGRDEVDAIRATANEQIDALVRWAANDGRHLIAVSDEVGSGVVPAYRLGRLFRDLLGDVNQRLAACANQVLLVVAGVPIDLRRIEWKPQ